MLTRQFTYKKLSGEQKIYDVLVLSQDQENLNGLVLNDLVPEDLEKVMKIQQDYEQALNPYVKKHFRKFLKSGIVEHPDSEVKENS